MNITLSADKKLIENSREYARRHNTSLNNLIRGYLIHLSNAGDAVDAAIEFEDLAQKHPGKSQPEFKFKRDEIYNRSKNNG